MGDAFWSAVLGVPPKMLWPAKHDTLMSINTEFAPPNPPSTSHGP